MSYTYQDFFRHLYKMNLQNHDCRVNTVEEFLFLKDETRAHLSALLGLPTLAQMQEQSKSVSLCPELLDTKKENGYTRYKLKIQTLPEVSMPFYMMIPDGISISQPSKTMIAIPAHGANKDSVCGVLSCEAVREKLISSPNENYGQTFAQKGYIVFCPDPPGYGERLESTASEDRTFLGDEASKSNPLGSTCKNLTMTAEALGLTFAGLVLWDMKKLIDFIESLPFVDMNRLGCCGFSGGGLYTMWLAAMDDRIRLAIISGYLHGYYDSILETHLCPCNFVPGLWKKYDISDIASLIAPRPLFFENGNHDVLNGSRGLVDPLEQYERIKQNYKLLKKEDLVIHKSFDGPHMWGGLGVEFAEIFL